MWQMWSNFRLKLTRSIANTFGYELEITVDDHEIDVKFVDPENKERKAWDSNHFVSGNIFYKDYANPINFKMVDEQNLKFISSERYETFMEQSLIDDIVRSSKENSITLIQAVIVIVLTQLTTIGLMVFL